MYILCCIEYFLHILLSGVNFVLYRALFAHVTLRRTHSLILDCLSKTDLLNFHPCPSYTYRLYELNEHIEILDATINFKNSSINSQELHLAQLITDSEEETRYHSQLHSKLHSLPLRDAQALLVRYFHKVVRLRLEEGREVQRQREMDIELEGQRDAVRRLERSLRQTRVDCERELLSQQKVCSYMLHNCAHVLMKLPLDLLKF